MSKEPGITPRTKFIDYDARHKSKTTRYCVICQKDIMRLAPARIVRVNGVVAIHPEDVEPGVGEDFLLGMDCARNLGLEFSRKEPKP
jgi:hypothetical protein